MLYRPTGTSAWRSLAILIVVAQILAAAPNEQEIGPSLLRTSHGTSAAEDRALAQALRESEKALASEPGKPLVDFLKRYPDSGWRASLLADLGTYYRTTGRFTKALDAFEEAWTLTSGGSSQNERMVANWALGELFAMHSHLGHPARLAQLFAAAEARD